MISNSLAEVSMRCFQAEQLPQLIEAQRPVAIHVKSLEKSHRILMGHLRGRILCEPKELAAHACKENQREELAPFTRSRHGSEAVCLHFAQLQLLSVTMARNHHRLWSSSMDFPDKSDTKSH